MKVKRINEILMVDVSGSMERHAQEIRHILHEVSKQCPKTIIVFFDTTLHNIILAEDFDGDWLPFRQSGTDFSLICEVFDLYQPDCVTVLTDGESEKRYNSEKCKWSIL